MAIVIEALAEKAISSLLEAVTSLLREKVDLILNAKDELKKLQRKLERLEVSLKDVDHKPFFSSERDRYLEGELKDVFYDAQDIIEKYQTEIKISKWEKDSLTSWNKVRKPWITLCSCFKEHVHDSYKFSIETKKINERLDAIKKDREMVDLLKTTPSRRFEDPVHGEHDNSRETTHHMGAQPPTGREDDKRETVKRLLSDESAHSSMTKKGSVSIISIVGKGGIGKTTLAKMVFSEIEQHFGERRWWVCVSERPNREDLLQKILKEVHKKSKEDINSSLSLGELCTQLRNELSKEKFLLVLDDVWELNWWEEEVGGTLMAGAMGSKILITSRKKDVSVGMGAYYMHELPELNFQQSWDLFLTEALREGQTEEDLVMHKIKDVEERIVKKCGGLPLVIKTVGSMMRPKKMSRENWKSVEDSKIWEWKRPATSSSSSEIGGDILPGLMLSYDDLPYYLKSCFVYCCIYPKDYEIEREKLIMQWVAHGLIEEKKHVDVEATANQYIQDLIRQCLIEENNESYYTSPRLKLHDILHDLASYVGGEEYSHASASQRTRHMSLLRVNNVEETMHNVTATTHKLRTLLSKSIPSAYLTYFKWLRILSLMEYRMEELPNSIGDLALLKYLDLSNSNVRRLPSSIGRLCNLQTLDLRHSCIEELPKEMGELCNLRYLGLKPTFCLKFIAEGLGKLTNLQTLHRFLVCDDKGDTNGCDIRELKDLNKLKGGLSIEGLGGSRKAIDDVGNAQLLKEKHGITSLEFSFGIIGGDDEQSGVMEALEPPLGLECLKISYYKGQMPAWHLKAEYYTMLQTLVLERCFLWEKIISIASLKVLHVTECPELCEIAGMSALESLGVNECGSLEQLTHDMPALKWLMVKCCSSLKTISNMHALLSLEVSWCGSLEQLPHDMPALKSLKVERCDSLKALVNMHALESLEAKDCRSLKELPHHMPALESLNVSYCGRLEQLPHHMPALKSLKVEQCHMLKTVANTPALESLKVSWCDKLEQLPHHMPALKSLKVEGCNWEGWPAGRSEETTLTSMPRLREANFMNCPKMQIEGLIDELPGLQILIVSECPSARLGWKLLQQLPNLIHLQLDPKSAVLVPSPLPSQVSTFLPSLKSLDLNGNRNVDKVEWGRVPEWVWNLSQLEKLGLRHFSEDFSLGGHWQCLPKLRELSLWRLPNLKSLVDVNNVTMHQNEDDSVAKASPMDANEQIACLSKLEKLEIFLCPSLRLPQELRDHLGERLSIRGRRG